MKLLLLLSALLAPLTASSQVARPNYAEGQVWESRGRTADDHPLLKIQHIESDKGGRPIYHISVVNAGPPIDQVAHLPVSKTTLDESAVRLVSSDAAFPDVEEGIKIWRDAEGGVFTVPIAEVLSFIGQTLQKQ